ncbi:SPASM domain-containing protein [bacterium]|nr:SPASM domain-containing protein [bacterium]
MKKHSIQYHVKRMPYYYRLMQIMWSYHCKRQAVVPYRPYRVWIEPTNRCNLKCVMCPNQYFSEDALGFMEFRLFQKIIDEIKDYIYDINLHHRGESTLHPQLPEMIRYAHTRGLLVKLHTNGTILNEKKARLLIESGLDLISFSFDGYEAKGYEKIRQGARFQGTLDNIHRFLLIKRQTGADKPKTVMEIMELDSVSMDPKVKSDFIADLDNRGLDRLIIKKPHNWGGNVHLNTYTSLEFTPCTFPWHAVVVSWDGTVGPCPHDFFGTIQLGNANEQTLQEIFNAPPMQSLRNKMQSGFECLELPCRECDSVRRKQACRIPLASLKYIKE